MKKLTRTYDRKLTVEEVKERILEANTINGESIEIIVFVTVSDDKLDIYIKTEKTIFLAHAYRGERDWNIPRNPTSRKASILLEGFTGMITAGFFN